MQNSIKEIQRIFFLMMISIAVFTYIIIMIPTNTVLKNNMIEKFIIMSRLHEEIAQHFVDSCLQTASNLSSRIIAKRGINDYYQGIISLHELERLTLSLYSDGIIALNDITGAFRVVDNQIIATYKNVSLDKTWDQKQNKLYYQIDIDDNEITVVVFSPITDNSSFLGYDVLFFDIKKFIATVTDEVLKVSILPYEKLNSIKGREVEAELLINSNAYLIDDGFNTNYLKPIGDTDSYYHVQIPNNVLYKSIYRLRKILPASLIFSMLSIILLTNFITIKKFGLLISKVEMKKDIYKSLATRDALTGTYSRLLLSQIIQGESDIWKEQNKSIPVILIDIDRFKQINDTYGHLVGDEVLKKVTEILQTNLSVNDLLIRYGGDEFLILLAEGDLDRGQAIMSNVQQFLNKSDAFPFQIQLSFGISIATTNDDLTQVITNADLQMYYFKKQHRSIVEKY